MRKYIFLTVLLITGLTVLIIIYLNIYGINTNKFNDLIDEKIKDVHPNISLKIKDVFLKLNLKEKAIKINTQNTKVYIDKNFIDLSNLDINIDLIKFLRNENSLKNIRIISKENSIKNVTSFLNSYKFNLSRFIIFNQIEENSSNLFFITFEHYFFIIFFYLY